MFLRLALHAFPLTLSVLFLGMSATSAHAYLDAGTGSMILQVLLGGAAGVAIAGKLYWYKLLSLFGIKRSVEEDSKTDGTLDEAEARVDR